MYLLFAHDENGPEPYLFLVRYNTLIKCLKAMNTSKFTSHEIQDVRNDEWYEFVKESDGKIRMRRLLYNENVEWISLYGYEDAIHYMKKETFFQYLKRHVC